MHLPKMLITILVAAMLSSTANAEAFELSKGQLNLDTSEVG